MDEWNNHSFIIWRTRKEGNTVMERRRRGGMDRGSRRKVRSREEEKMMR